MTRLSTLYQIYRALKRLGNENNSKKTSVNNIRDRIADQESNIFFLSDLSNSSKVSLIPAGQASELHTSKNNLLLPIF